MSTGTLWFILINILLTLSCASSQDIDITPYIPPSTCYTCHEEVNNTACNENITVCEHAESCQNVVVENAAYGIHYVYKGCVNFYKCAYTATALRCATNTTTNTTTCFYCCVGEKCNGNEIVEFVEPDFIQIIYDTLIYDHAKRVTVLSILFGVLTSICLITAIFGLIMSGLLSKTAPFIHLNLCIATLISQFLLMIRTMPKHHEEACKVLAFLIQYFYLVGGCNFALEGIHLLFTVASNTLHVWKKWQVILVGWALPFIVTVISFIAVRQEGYGMPSPLQKYCWLSIKIGAWWGLFVPLCFVFIISLIVVITTGVLRNRVKDNQDDDKYKKFRSNYVAFIVVLIVYILTWLFGFMEMDPFRVHMPYMFVVLHALLVVIISLFYCALNYEVKLVLTSKISPN